MQQNAQIAEVSSKATIRARLVFALITIGIFALSQYLSPPGSTSLFLNPTTDLQLKTASTDVPDFSSISDVDLKKQTFFNFLQPYIDDLNATIQRQRESLLVLSEKVNKGYSLTRSERVLIRRLSAEYRMDTDSINDPGYLTRLLRRVDQIPPSLVLAQAANESAWGTSRFAQQGKNFFGQWCFSQGCGLVPSRRRADASHEVKAFDTIAESVAAYFKNLNTFPSYQDLRLIRERLRDSNRPLNGIALAEGLDSYSERGEDYIAELQSMIEYNALLERDARLTRQLVD